jgi:hypothetical protein
MTFLVRARAAAAAAAVLALALAPAASLAQPGPTHDPGGGRAGYDYAADAMRHYCVDNAGVYVGCGGGGGGGTASSSWLPDNGGWQAATTPTTTSSTTVFTLGSGAGPVAYLRNTSTAGVAFHYRIGTAGVAALTTDDTLTAGMCVPITRGTADRIALITAASSGTAEVTTGTGNPGYGPCVDWSAAAATYDQPSPSALYGLVPVASTAAETGHIVKASPGNLYSLEVTTGASAGFVMIHNSTTVPAAGAVTPKKCYAVAANTTTAWAWTKGIYFGTGVSVSFSTTGCFTQTDSATAYISADAA